MPEPVLEDDPDPLASILPGYKSIGEFYKELQHGELAAYLDSLARLI